MFRGILRVTDDHRFFVEDIIARRTSATCLRFWNGFDYDGFDDDDDDNRNF